MNPLPLLDLSRGDSADATPPPIAEAGAAAIAAGHTHYTDPCGTPALRAAIAQALRDDLNVGYAPQDEILVTAGAAPAIAAAVLALTAPGDGVLVPEPGWSPYTQMLTTLGRRPLPYAIPWAMPDASPETWGLSLRAHITPDVRLLILNFPHNPTGTLLDDPHLAILSALCAAYPQLALLSDEVYGQIVFDGQPYRSPVSLPSLAPRTVVVRSFSKAYAMAGWRVGYLAASAPLVAPIRRTHLALNALASSIAQEAALWALLDGADLVAGLRCRWQANRDYLVEMLNRLPPFRCASPPGTFYLFPDISGGGMSSAAFAARLAESHRVRVYPGSDYGSHGEGHIRLCFAHDRAILEAFVDRMTSLRGD